MLLLNLPPSPSAPTLTNISIHLMLLLNAGGLVGTPAFIGISIHLMLLLNQVEKEQGFKYSEFQYILCCY